MRVHLAPPGRFWTECGRSGQEKRTPLVMDVTCRRCLQVLHARNQRESRRLSGKLGTARRLRDAALARLSMLEPTP